MPDMGHRSAQFCNSMPRHRETHEQIPIGNRHKDRRARNAVLMVGAPITMYFIGAASFAITETVEAGNKVEPTI